MIWRTFANTLLASLFEPPCAACARPLSHPLDGAVCEQCWASVSGGALLTDFPRGHGIDWAGAVAHYDGRLRDIIHALKYEGRRSLAKPLGGLMRERGAKLLVGADAVVPVPLHPRRERERGFNQADDLARQLGLPVVPLLRRVKFTTSQIELPAGARHQNVRDAFAIAGGRADQLRQGYGGQEAGRHIFSVVVLVDDVSTTGATLDACARVLKHAGVKEVRALTAARVVTGRR
jgi:ComF family protein